MSWKLIKSIQGETDLRLILPFGLSLKVGDVISVSKGGNFTLEGSCELLLGVSAGKPRPAQGGEFDLLQQSGRNTEYKFRTAGTSSNLFSDLVFAQAGFDISFAVSDSWLLALTGRAIDSLDGVNRFRLPILEAYQRGVWKPDWALVTSAAKVEKMTLLASSSSRTKVALSLGAEIDLDASIEVKLTSDVTIIATNQQFVKCVTTEPTTAFCTAMRVKDSWWRDPYLSTLTTAVDAGYFRRANDSEFWEDIDAISPSGASGD